MANNISGLPPGINPILAKTAQEAATGKAELQVFLSDNELKILNDPALMSANKAYPKDERFPLPVFDFLMKAKLGISPQAMVTALETAGLTKQKGEQLEVYKDIGNGKIYARLFVPPSPGDVNEVGNPISSAEVPGRWAEISPRAVPKQARVVTDGPKPKIADRLAAASGDPRLSQLKGIVQKAFATQKADGSPLSPEDLWKGVAQASQGNPSKLSQMAWGVAGAMASKGGKVDWAATQAKATMLEQSILAEASRHINLDTGKPNTNYKSLQQIADLNAAAVKASNADPANPTAIGATHFKTELEKLTGGKFVATEAPEVMGNGQNQKAFDNRLNVINNAKTDINYAMWKFYPDEVGTKTSDALAAAAKRGVKVNVVVDGNVASRDPGEQALLKKMSDAGVNVTYWHDDKNPMNGMHAKMILADCSAEAQKAGGKNWNPIRLATDRNDGAPYLLDKGDPNDTNRGWSGTDMVFKGSGAASGMDAFRALYNANAARTGKPQMGAETVADLSKAHGSEQVMSIADVSGPDNKQTISKSIEKLLDGVKAGETVKVDQAYFMGLPGIEDAMKRALARGVNLQILTNSAESCDVPGINSGTTAILQRLNNKDLMNSEGHGKLEMFEYKGKQTLHDKMMVFGNQATMRMSFNQHGRSQELECEDGDVVMGAKTAAAAAANFDSIALNPEKAGQLFKPSLTTDEASMLPVFDGLLADLT